MQGAQRRVSGRIAVRETGSGIAGLVVTVLDARGAAPRDSRSVPAELSPSADVMRSLGGTRRLGAVLTDEDGAFDLAYADPEQPVDLLLVVNPPEVIDGAACTGALHVSCDVRRNAAAIEQFAIQIPASRLETFGVAAPQPGGAQGARIERAALSLRAASASRSEIAGVGRALTQASVEALRGLDQSIERSVGDLRVAVSQVPESLRQDPGFVGDEDTIEATCLDVIRAGVRDRIQPSRRRGRLSLGADVIEALGGAAALDAGVQLDEARFRAVVAREDAQPTALVRVDAVDLLCAPRPMDECAALLEEPHAHEDPPAPAAEPTELVPAGGTGDALQRALDRLLDTVTSPEMGVAFGIAGPADEEAIRRKLQRLSIGTGPADTPRFYDFYNLQIAFPHVWMEALDERLVQDARDAYRQIVELGGQAQPPAGRGGKSVGPLFHEARLLHAAGGTSDPAPEVLRVFDVSPQQWNALDAGQRQVLADLGAKVLDLEERPVTSLAEATRRPAEIARHRRQGERLLEYTDRKLRYLLRRGAMTGYAHLHDALAALEKRLKEPYAFTVYAASAQQRSVNFGVLVHYRQKWTPLSYQAGEMVDTITLTPGEKRRFAIKEVVKRSRAEKAATSESHVRSRDESESGRIESEIVRRAQARTNFSLGTEGTYNILLSKGTATATFGKDAETESQDVKRQFRESVVKAAEEVKRERSHEVSTSEETTLEAERSGELTNPNDELAVTYLFYELQRRYHVSEQLHAVTPVILVAQEVPKPHEIDEDWLIAHDWILRRVILDTSFLPALAYLSSRVVGDELALEERRRTLEQQRRLAEQLQGELVGLRRTVAARQDDLDRSIERQAQIQEAEDTEGRWGWISDWISGEDASPEAARIRKEAAEARLERVRAEERELFARLEREQTALNAATEAYTAALREHLDRRVQVERLRVHVKQNILYYMQAIWAHEPPDQRFFRLHNVRVPTFGGTRTYRLRHADPGTVMYPHWDVRPVEVEATVEVSPELELAPLVEVADLDNPLGFKGNYMIFPLRQPNALTEYMVTPYLHPVLGVRDPDPHGDWTLDDFVKYVCCLKRHVTAEEFEARRPALAEQYRRLVRSPSRSSSEIIVPTGSLFIEALPGTHSLLEPYKAMHRAVDLKRVQSEVRERELENLRLARRLLEGNLEDPHIEKQIVIRGGNGTIIVPPGDEA